LGAAATSNLRAGNSVDAARQLGEQGKNNGGDHNAGDGEAREAANGEAKEGREAANGEAKEVEDEAEDGEPREAEDEAEDGEPREDEDGEAKEDMEDREAEDGEAKEDMEDREAEDGEAKEAGGDEDQYYTTYSTYYGGETVDNEQYGNYPIKDQAFMNILPMIVGALFVGMAATALMVAKVSIYFERSLLFLHLYYDVLHLLTTTSLPLALSLSLSLLVEPVQYT
jgi:hypothetical protein